MIFKLCRIAILHQQQERRQYFLKVYQGFAKVILAQSYRRTVQSARYVRPCEVCNQWGRRPHVACGLDDFCEALFPTRENLDMRWCICYTLGQQHKLCFDGDE